MGTLHNHHPGCLCGQCSPETRETFHVRLSVETISQIREAARQRGQTMAEFIRRAVDAAIQPNAGKTVQEGIEALRKEA